MSELPKTFDPAAIESRWYAHWEHNNLFRPERPDAEPWTIVNPPPNVTGSLHIGHALDNTLQDILTRHARLKGKDALWVVGTDHAGIATQMVVERNLESQGLKRQEMGREAFLEHVWEWKAQSGGAITRQLRRLGCSMDWSREQFTMDPHFVRAVNKVFVQLYREGLLYRAKRLVNWDPKLKTAISDLEVEAREVRGHMWHFKYPLAGGETYTYVERDADGQIVLEEERDYIAIATTRPETMLGDGAVAVHPDDPRYRPIVGKLCEIPVGAKEHRRLIPIITDDYPDPAFGSGAVKITGAHDENDYGVAQRNNIPMYRLMDEVAAMRRDGASYAEAAARARELATGATASPEEIDTINLVPDAYRGLDRFEARERVVADIDAEGLMIKVEDKLIMQPFGDRGGVVIEPMLTDQWYVDAATLAKPAIEAVRSGAIKVVPKTWEKTWFNWLENIQPWTISRQLWWGHQIPAWYDEQGNVFVGETEEEARAEAGGRALKRDPDVLDTWFSSALWPFATLGWPEEQDGQAEPARPEPVEGLLTLAPQANGEKAGLRQAQAKRSLLNRHYPNDVLISGFDIIFFWDARMAMQGIHFMGEVPWKTLYLHGLVRDAKGQKMSKSKGNTVDPLGLIDRYGADALRFTLAAMESQGRDIKLDEKRVEGYRNFATKLWNASRFCQANGIGASRTIEPPRAELPVNRWIVGETVRTVQALDLAMAELRFDESANTIYQFVWATFCDWYLELIKPVLGGGAVPEPHEPVRPELVEGPSFSSPQTNGASAGLRQAQAERDGVAETREVARWVLDQILVMLHPFMPFITEELWHALADPAHPRPYELILAKWPMPDARALDPEAGPEIDWLIRLVSGIRTARTELGVPPGAKLPLHVRDADARTLARLERNRAALQRLARIEAISAEPASGGAAQVVVDEATFVLPLAGVIDIASERARLTKALQAAEKERDGLAGRLGNPSFVDRAKPEAVEKARADHAEKSSDADKYRAALARLG